MENTIVSIKEVEVKRKDRFLPDGLYAGVWGGNTICVRYKEVDYELETSEGVRGIGYKVVVEVKKGIATWAELNN